MITENEVYYPWAITPNHIIDLEPAFGEFTAYNIFDMIMKQSLGKGRAKNTRIRFQYILSDAIIERNDSEGKP
jgi:hypothetical protein